MDNKAFGRKRPHLEGSDGVINGRHSSCDNVFHSLSYFQSLCLMGGGFIIIPGQL